MTDAPQFVLQALRAEAASAGDDRLMQLCAAAESLYGQVLSERQTYEDMATALVKIGSILATVKSNTPAQSVRTAFKNVQGIIDSLFTNEFDTQPSRPVEDATYGT